MPHSHHSHSGQFCNHAADDLASVLAEAASKRMSLYCLTEHCPRDDAHLYPGERDAGYDHDRQHRVYDDFIAEATRLRDEYASREGGGTRDGMQILIGFEAEWITHESSTRIVRDLLSRHAAQIDFFVGSVHFVRETPIDYDAAFYARARDLCGGSDERLFAEYFDAQYEMLRALRPRVVGHFDLVRLFSEAPDRGWRGSGSWGRIVRNLEFVRGYGGVLELNSSALRKGLEEPYPRSEICRQFDGMGGLFVLSDDCHAISHVATNYARLLDFIQRTGLKRIAHLVKSAGGVDVVTESVEEMSSHPFWHAASNSSR